jgi:general secretion pathway protein M
MQDLLRYWSDRAPREKAILAAGAAVVLLALVYLVMIEPARSGIARLERSLPAMRAQAVRLEGLLAEFNALKSRPQVATINASEARGTLEKSLAAAGLKATRIQPLSEGDLQLSFSGVLYANWTGWLAETERTLGARALSVSATRVDAAGKADIELVLRLARR